MYHYRLSLYLDSLENAPPASTVIPNEVDGDKYVYIRVTTDSRFGSFSPPRSHEPLILSRRYLFSDYWRRDIRDWIYSLQLRRNETPRNLVNHLIESTAAVERQIAADPAFSDARMVPLRLDLELVMEGGGDRALEAVTELSMAEAVVAMVPADEAAIREVGESLALRGEYSDCDRCIICLEEFGGPCGIDDDGKMKIVRTPCKHVYHRKCIVEWFGKSHLCPLCRYAMPTSKSYDC